MPSSLDNAVRELHQLAQIVLYSHSLPVLEDFTLRGVELRPLNIRLPRKLVDMRWDVFDLFELAPCCPY